MSEPQAQSAVVRRPNLIAERVLDETVVLDPEADVYVRLNSSGGWMWEQLEQPRSVDGLARELAARYGLEEHRAKADVTAFVDGLLERRLVEPAWT